MSFVGILAAVPILHSVYGAPGAHAKNATPAITQGAAANSGYEHDNDNQY